MVYQTEVINSEMEAGLKIKFNRDEKQIPFLSILNDFNKIILPCVLHFASNRSAKSPATNWIVFLLSIGCASAETRDSHWLISAPLPADQRKHPIANARGDLNETNTVRFAWRTRWLSAGSHAGWAGPPVGLSKSQFNTDSARRQLGCNVGLFSPVDLASC